MQLSHDLCKSNRKTTRRRRDDTARRNIVSVRVSDQERQVLETITESTRRNVSDLVREALDFWLSNNGKHLKVTPKKRSKK